jgi:hypothetical protein
VAQDNGKPQRPLVDPTFALNEGGKRFGVGLVINRG